MNETLKTWIERILWAALAAVAIACGYAAWTLNAEAAQQVDPEFQWRMDAKAAHLRAKEITSASDAMFEYMALAEQYEHDRRIIAAAMQPPAPKTPIVCAPKSSRAIISLTPTERSAWKAGRRAAEIAKGGKKPKAQRERIKR